MVPTPDPSGVAPGVAEPSTVPRVTAPSRRSRLAGLDLARAVALVGMLVAHYTYLDGTGGSLRAVNRFVDGKAMPLFLLLSGVGFTFLTRRAAHPVAEVLGRAALLLVLGLALHEHVPLIAVILHFYAAYFLAGLLVRRLAGPWLLALAAGVTAVGALTWLYVAPDVAGYPGWQGWDTLTDPWPLLSSLVLTGVYPVLPSFAFFLVGMWVGRLQLEKRWVAWRLATVGVLLALVGYGLGGVLDRAAEGSAMVERDGLVVASPSVVAELAARLGSGAAEVEARLEVLATEYRARTGASPHQALARTIESQQRQAGVTRVTWLLDTAGHGNMPLWVVGATGYALAVVGGCLLLARRWPGAVRAGAAAGELALTFYVAHALALRWWYPYATEHRTYTEQLVAVAVIAAGFAAAALAWRRRLPRGPVEALLRAAGRAAGVAGR